MKNSLNKILLVEDEKDIQTIAQISLEEIGKFTVKYCSSGKEALGVAETFVPDLILLDMMMPGMDGIATLQALRQNPATKNIPVIFMTAKVQTNEVDKYRQLGALDVIAKPFDPMALADNLRKIWSQHQ